MGSENNRLHQLKLLVTNAKLKEPPGLFTKGDPYAEVTVDGQPPHKTDPAKGTWEPCWNHPFDLLVSVFYIVLCLILTSNYRASYLSFLSLSYRALQFNGWFSFPQEAR